MQGRGVSTSVGQLSPVESARGRAAAKAGPRDKPYKLPDAGGLYLFVTPAETRIWRYKFRSGGKEKLLVIGRYPEIGLKAARLAHDEAKRTLASGRDPGLEARRVKLVGQGRAEDTFEKWAREWYEAQRPRWKPVHASDVIDSLERDLFPTIGAFPVTDIGASASSARMTRTAAGSSEVVTRFGVTGSSSRTAAMTKTRKPLWITFEIIWRGMSISSGMPRALPT